MFLDILATVIENSGRELNNQYQEKLIMKVIMHYAKRTLLPFPIRLCINTIYSVMSAIREANLHNITVKGGKLLEAVAEADTIVFDKTGTLTKAMPTVAEVISFNEMSPDELLRIAACMEEHFPHSMVKWNRN